MQNLMSIELPISTSVVCHDAGGANLIVATLQAIAKNDCRAYMQGPAKKIWQSVFPQVTLYDSINQAIEGSELLITGSGWASNIEHDARLKAQYLGIQSIAIIDHWVNYPERFIRNGKQVLPDQIWVSDKYALDLALTIFPEVPILQIPNYYLENQLKYIAPLNKTSNSELLYILEPIRTDWGRDIAGEFQALEYFINNFHKLDLPSEIIILLRPHPSDLPGKYDNWIKLHSNFNIKLDGSINIVNSLSRASWVAGCESFALVLALLAGRKVYCSLPPWAPPCRLPYNGLISLRELD